MYSLLSKHEIEKYLQIFSVFIFPIYLACIGDGNILFPSISAYIFLTLLISFVTGYAFFNFQKIVYQIKNQGKTVFWPAIVAAIYLLIFTFYGITVSIKILCAVVVLMMLVGRKQLSAQHMMALIFLIGTFERAWFFFDTSSGAGSDMLPLVNSAITSFFNGENPYRLHEIKTPSATNQLLLSYLPGLWISYIPGFLLKIDLRIINIVAEFIAALLLYASSPNSRSEQEKYLTVAFIALWYCNPYFAVRIDAEIAIFNLATSFLVWSLAKNYIWAAFLAAALSLLICQLALVYIPFLLTYLIIKAGYQKSIIGISAMLAIVALGILPFLNKDLLDGVFRHWQLLCFVDFNWAASSILNFNFAVFAYYFKVQGHLVYIQALICISSYLIFIALKAYRSLPRTIMFAAFILLSFIQFNILVWTYLFSPVVTLMVFGLTLELSNSKD